MAIPPIISNNPILKLFKTDKSGGIDATQKAAEAPNSPQDVVEISEAARKRLDGVKELSSDNPAEIKTVAENARDILEESGVTLGLDSSFS